MKYTSAYQRLQIVKKYIECRIASSKPDQSLEARLIHAQTLKSFFADDGVLIDWNHKTYTDNLLLNYFQDCHFEPVDISDPQLLKDSRFLSEFSVYLMWVPLPIKAYFEFSKGSYLIAKLTISANLRSVNPP